MTATERATQIWPILVLCASRRETLTYDLLGRLIGVPIQGVAEFLEPIQSYCLLEGLAPLAAIVVDQTTGLPENGSIPASKVPHAQAEVYAQDWLRNGPPHPEAFDDATEGMVYRRARLRQERAAKAKAAKAAKAARGVNMR